MVESHGELPSPIDTSFATLDCELTPLDPKSEAFKIIQVRV